VQQAVNVYLQHSRQNNMSPDQLQHLHEKLTEAASQSVPIKQLTKEDRSRLRVTYDNIFDL